MNELRMILVAALCGVVLVACGDDDVRPVTPPDMGPRDMNMADLGPPPDLGPPVDLGPGADLGPGTDMGTPVGMCPAGACDLVTNGCPSGEGCYFLSMGASMPPMPICTTSGIGTTGASCTTYSDCAPGFVCQGAMGATPGACQKYCCDVGSSAGCPAGASCSIVLTDATGMPTGAALCHSPSNCAIFGSDCATDEGCYVQGGDGTTDCAQAGTEVAGGDCHYSNDCAPGYICLGMAGMTSKCSKLCDTVDMNPSCPGTTTCVSRALPAPLTNVGVCTAP